MMVARELEETMPRPEGGRLADLYAAHAPDAARLAYLLTGDRALAEDLVQEAFVRLFGRFRDIRQPEAFPAYLRKTVVNLAKSHFRRRRVERSYLERRQPDPPEGEPTVDDMWTRLQALRPRQRAAIILRYYEDLSESQTADILGCPVGTVKSLVSRGIEQLRARIDQEGLIS